MVKMMRAEEKKSNEEKKIKERDQQIQFHEEIRSNYYLKS